MNIKQVLVIGFGAILSAVGVSSIVSNYTTLFLEESQDWVLHTYDVQIKLKNIEKNLLDAETGQRGFIYTGDETFLEPYNLATQMLDRNFEILEDLISDNSDQVMNLQNIKNLSQQKLNELAETIQLKRAKKEQEILILVTSKKGQVIMDEIRINLDEMHEIENQFLDQRLQHLSVAYRLIDLVNWGTLVVVIFVEIMTIVWINKIAVNPITKFSSHIAASSSQIAESVEEQEEIAQQQASFINETTATANELGTSYTQSAEQADLANASAQETLRIVARGNTAVKTIRLEVINVQEQVEFMANKILELTEQIDKIGEISDVVRSIANQTNMLALNASVEAVRAGESGKGFSVIAVEIRKLADQSRDSTVDINNRVLEIQKAINGTTQISQKGQESVQTCFQITEDTTQTFEEVKNSVTDVVHSNQQITLNLKQQLIGVEQLIESITSINAGANNNASALAQIGESIQQLNNVALELKRIA
ncbi:CHASE3 domain-containing protein [Roseofilum sp. BLCC_M91]|uniref:CHASE3 domain-containing protein n=1 Tax=Roseofilum halophilum BLCC-M91 TaxID=3022259 RepID=A0ABT7BQS4_9CYAN|nr:CHASE3 domain-containing protein [Roseofilum halophilum]MDJ1180638.1 CHASE3 domain-containing protein [Roseofilum halophilum BLCC-M91]